MVKIDGCPSCGSDCFKKNGHLPNGKQIHRCKDYGRQFVLNPDHKLISAPIKALIKKTLLERSSLRWICRVFDVSLTWLLSFITTLYEELPDHLNLTRIEITHTVSIQRLEVEGDELWSFVGDKGNKYWIWLAMDLSSRQIIAFHVGDRSRNSARELWNKLPRRFQQHAVFYTDLHESYVGIIPPHQHVLVTKDSGKTNHIERFNCTLRQRVSRLVRKTLSFSKNLDNHIGAIKYFICHYNLSRTLALPV
jgi:IS1 family transposase/transposase-like protein